MISKKDIDEILHYSISILGFIPQLMNSVRDEDNVVQLEGLNTVEKLLRQNNFFLANMTNNVEFFHALFECIVSAFMVLHNNNEQFLAGNSDAQEAVESAEARIRTASDILRYMTEPKNNGVSNFY